MFASSDEDEEIDEVKKLTGGPDRTQVTEVRAA